MKTKTKLLAALLSTVTAFSCALTAAAAPAITLQGNETTPATANASGEATATLTLKATQFENVGGADLTLTLQDGITLASATVEDVANDASKWALEEDVNYRVSGNTVKMVDVFNIGDAPKKSSLELKLTFNVTGAAIGEKTVALQARLANTNEEFINDATITGGKLIIGREDATYNSLAAINVTNSGYFIPVGAYILKDGNYKFLDKDKDGNFICDENVNQIFALKCKLPSAGKFVTTFGASGKIANPESEINYEKSNGIQFGSYATDVDKDYGTFVVIGNYEAFKKANSNKYATDEALLSRVAALYDQYVKSESKFLKLSYNGNEVIYICRKTRTTYMWQGLDKGLATQAIQYALRVYNVDAAETYTAVGYSLEDGSYKFSTEIKAAVYEKM